MQGTTAVAGSGSVTIYSNNSKNKRKSKNKNKNKNKNSTKPSTTATTAAGCPVTTATTAAGCPVTTATTAACCPVTTVSTAAGCPVTIDDNSTIGYLDLLLKNIEEDASSNKYYILDLLLKNIEEEKASSEKRGCNICKEARKLLNCYEECICDSEFLELLLDKKDAIEENYKLVHSLYLIREQKSPGERYNPKERRKYGCLQPDFIWAIFQKFMNPIPDIPPNYISDRVLMMKHDEEVSDVSDVVVETDEGLWWVEGGYSPYSCGRNR